MNGILERAYSRVRREGAAVAKKRSKLKNRVFIDKLRDMLREAPDGYSLAEWQQLYRDVMFTMGMHILEQFPQEATRKPEDKHATGGPGGGGHASLPPCNFVEFPAFVLCIGPSPTR
jgi:hypothetical protein